MVRALSSARLVPLVASLWLVAGAGSAMAETLSKRLDLATPGSLITLSKGIHAGPITIDKPLTLVGEDGAVIEGDGQGNVITIDAPDVTLRGLIIRGSGRTLEREPSGVFVTSEGDRAVIEDNRILDNLFGVYLKGPEDALVRNNEIANTNAPRVPERGNGVHLWNTPGSRVIGNDIRGGRDGIFTTTSKHNAFIGNRFRDLRYAVHYMYTNDAVIQDNDSQGNHAGYVIMFSNRIEARGNLSRNDRDHGFLFNYANDAQVIGNRVLDGGEKCIFIYNAHRDRFTENHFEGCAIGIHFTAGSEHNTVTRNAFVRNRTQVKYVGTRDVVWAENGVGNYWSDNLAFDLNGDGIGDRPYRPNGLVDQVLWRAPAAKLLLSSPAMRILEWAQSAFPAVLPGGVVDPAPLMDPPPETEPLTPNTMTRAKAPLAQHAEDRP
ncbi:MAG: nitrous oxide reductase family maturation protein NosD [Rhodospirillum sp.]|nr:nitrous oxide reductase family maturation protein NosD [Rhodospirillum sp.]MCF8488390.1 nitrous oxide reductase family maturation protein NosD [Rhodospirillum sp.]